MDIKDLKKIGLTEGEIRLYDALLELGETTRTGLAKKSGVSPSKIYDVANRLLEKGIISSVKKQGVIHFSAANPERIKDYIESKEKEIRNEHQIVEQILPSLLLKYNKTEEETDIEVFYGWEGMKTVFYDIAKVMSKGDVKYVFGASKGKSPEQMNLFLSSYMKEVNKKGYKIKIIFNENVRGYKKRTDLWVKHPLHEVKYLHQDTFTEFLLYKRVSILLMLLRRPILIRIRNDEAYDSLLKFFSTMWEQAAE
ncbi:MAG: helix-turn-helix domain-containing protein [archaeon]